MEHYMRLHREPFSMIQNGTKTIEVRLNDNKRQKMSVGDTLVFTSRSNPEQTIQTKINELFIFKTFKDIFNAFPLRKFGLSNREDLDNIYQYYTQEQENEYGVVALFFEKE